MRELARVKRRTRALREELQAHQTVVIEMAAVMSEIETLEQHRADLLREGYDNEIRIAAAEDAMLEVLCTGLQRIPWGTILNVTFFLQVRHEEESSAMGLRMEMLSSMGREVYDQLSVESKRQIKQAAKDKKTKDAANKANYEKEMRKMNRKPRPKTYKTKTVQQLREEAHIPVKTTQASFNAFFKRLTVAEETRSEWIIAARVKSQEEEKVPTLCVPPSHAQRAHALAF